MLCERLIPAKTLSWPFCRLCSNKARPSSHAVSTLLILRPERKSSKVIHGNSREAGGGEAEINPRCVKVNVVDLLYTSLVYKGQHARVVRANLIDSMAIIRHGETTSHTKKDLFDKN
jgi:hypothetical protein